MIEAGSEAIIVGAVDGSALTDVLAKAGAKGIPVIAYDRLIRDSGDVDYYATFDNHKVGVLQGQALVKALGAAPGKGPFDIELFAGSPDDNNAGIFFEGAMSVLEPLIESGVLRVRSGQTGFTEVATQGWDDDKAKARMAGLLRTTWSEGVIDGVLAPNDGVARAVIGALQVAGYGKGSKPLPVMTGQDCELESVKLVAAGTQTMTIFKDTRELAKVAVQMTDALLNGDEPRVNDTEQYDNGVQVVPTFLLQPVGITQSNVEAVLVESGYLTAADLA